MCHSDESRPPAPPVQGEVAEHGAVELTSGDGTAFNAYKAYPATPNGKNVVILPDVRGLHPYYEALTQRFAEAGFHTVAIDYFGRTAGTGDRGDDFEFMPHVQQTQPDQVAADAATAVGFVNDRHPGDTYTVGFCFGGSHSWRMSAYPEVGVAGVVGFYGKPTLVRDVLPQLAKPMLLLIAGDDAATPQADFDAFDAELTEAGKDHSTVVYDGAPHAFFDRAFEEWKDACADAWQQIMSFTRA